MKSIISLSRLIASIIASLALGSALCGTAKGSYVWNGSSSTNLTDPANWNSSSVPAFGTSISNVFWVMESGALNPMIYSDSQGTTSFTTGGVNAIGHLAVGVLNMSGGTLNLSTAMSSDNTLESLWIGNGASPQGNGTLNLSGGTLNTTYSLLVGRDGSIGALNISGGTLTVSSNGVYIGNFGNAANGTITLSGSGSLIVQGATAASSGTACIFVRSGASRSSNYINFITGGGASLSLLSTADNFPALVSGSYVRINGAITTDTAQFTKTVSGGQNIYQTVMTTPPPAPVISSATSVSGNVGAAFSYQIAATNGPSSYNAAGLPPGLSVNTSTGLISGTLYADGLSNVTVSAVNTTGTGSAILALTANGPAVVAKPFVHPLFTNHMVLQRDSLDPVWGWTIPGMTVTVAIKDQNGSIIQTQTATAGTDGKWQAAVGPFGLVPNNAAYSIVITGPGTGAGSKTVTITDVLIGDVWLCSGQSNMERELGHRDNQSDIINYTGEIAAANYPSLRDFYVPERAATTPQVTVANTAAQTTTAASFPAGGVWTVWSPSNAAVLTAVGYFFARDIYQATNVPIGVLHSAWGGTTIAPWLETNAALGVGDLTTSVAKLPTQSTATNTNPSALYNAMIAPLTPFAIKGALWYQGESSASAPQQYSELLPALMKGWRSAFNNPTLPFIVVQLPDYGLPQTLPVEVGSWAELREAQFKSIQNDPNARMTVNIDIGDPTGTTSFTLHPRDKQDVGQRAAWAALNLAYGQNLVYSGPIFTGASVEGNSIRCSFDQVGAGLMTGTKSWSALTPASQVVGAPVTGFALSGTDKVFYNAVATIDPATNTVLVSSTNVPSPVAVRYGWGYTPACNLYAKITDANGNVVDGLPASPFRNDPVTQLSVNSGSGSASPLSPGQIVSVSASAAPAGQSFGFWSGDTDLVTSATTASTTGTMGRTYVSLLANYKLNTAPTGLTGYPTGLRSALAWNPATNAYSYNVKRAASSGGPYTTIATGVVTNYFVDNSAGLGTTWYYVVSAVNFAGESPNSAQVTVTPLPPAAPGLTATVGNGTVYLSWNSVTNATNYILSRTTTSGSNYTQVSAYLTGNTYVDTGLSNGTTYFYTISSVYNSSAGPASMEVSATPSSATSMVRRSVNGSSSASAINAPNETDVQAFDSNTNTKWFTNGVLPPVWLQYQFGASSAWAINQYQVSSANDVPGRDPKDWQLQGSDDGVNWTVLDSRSGQTFASRFQTNTYTFSNSTPFRYYRLYITANNGDTTGVQLSELALYSSPSDPGDKVGPVIYTPGNLTVNGTSSAGTPVSYSVYAYDDISGFAPVTCTPASGSVFPTGTTSVQCTATDGSGNTSAASFNITVIGQPAITSPNTASTTVGNVFSYQITASNNPTSFDATGLPAGLSVDTTTGLISGAPTTFGTTNVTIKATNAAGSVTATLALTIAPVPTSNLALGGVAAASAQNAPNEGAAQAFDGNISTKWYNYDGAIHSTGWLQYQFASGTAWAVRQYRITSASDVPQRDPAAWQFMGSNDGVNWTVLDTQSGQTFANRGQTNVYSFTNGTPYSYYRLNITANAGGSAYGIQLAELGLYACAGPLTGLGAVSGSSQATLSWPSINGANSYNVYRSATSGTSYSLVLNVSGTTCTDQGLTNGTLSYYVVTSVGSGGESSYSNEVAVLPGTVPSPWQPLSIGSTGGGANYSGTNFTLEGMGSDIWGTSDQFQFLYQTGGTNCSIVAKVLSVQNTNAWAKVGVMIRESLNANSTHATAVITPGSGAAFQWRPTTGGSSNNISVGGIVAPCWVKVTRSGSTFSAYRSADGVTWTQIGSSATINMGGSVYIGLVDCSHTPGWCAAQITSVTAIP